VKRLLSTLWPALLPGTMLATTCGMQQQQEDDRLYGKWFEKKLLSTLWPALLPGTMLATTCGMQQHVAVQ
jgi:hypothetical protein